MKISIIGAGYVGLANALLFNKNYKVCLFDINKERVNMINNKICYLKDVEMQEHIKSSKILATTDFNKCLNNAEIVLLCLPTNLNKETNTLETNIIEENIEKISKSKFNPLIIIKSTVPIGFTDRMIKKYNNTKILFSPEFLREGTALYDCMNPDRIVIGCRNNVFIQFQSALKNCTKNNAPVLIMQPKEAEAVKLFSNTYLAMRVAFFNELDTFSQIKNINSEKIIEAVCKDKRIGDFYNKPSLGFGGYCLPKDSTELKEEFLNIPNTLIKSIPESNFSRKCFIANTALQKINSTENPIIGLERITAKKNGDNFRESAILDIMNILNNCRKDISFLIFEPLIKEKEYNGIQVENDYQLFKQKSTIIIKN